MTHSRLSQQGQAAVEATLALLVLVPMFVGIVWLGRLQYSALSAAQTSRQSAFLSAHGQSANSLHASIRVNTSIKHWRVPEVGNGHVSAAALADDWLRAGRGLLQVTSSNSTPIPRFFATDAGAKKYLGVHRHTSILIGAGHAEGDSNAQRRIGESDMGWSIAASNSTFQANRLRAQLRRVDEPWKRGEVSMDWLGTWDELIPIERLGRARSSRRR